MKKIKIANKFYLLIITFFSFTSCLKWAARADKKLPDETALHKTYHYSGKVIIIGAGASGLAAAKVLEKNNVNYKVLEATNRYGGRLKKDTILADFPIDIGAEWLHSAPITLNKLKGKYGDEIDEELIPYHLDCTAIWNGTEYKVNSSWQNDFRYNFLPESKFKNTTWYDFVNENIAKTVLQNIHYNSPVVSIDYSNNKVSVITTDGTTYEADRILVTVPIGVLKSEKISFIPEIKQERKDAIDEITFHPGFKVVMKFSDKFYPDAIECDVDNGEKGYYDIAFGKETQDNILAFLCTGDETQKYYDLNSNEQIMDSLLSELDQIFDGKASSSYSGEYVLENWGQYEFALGTWTQAFQEKKSNLKILNQSLDQKVYFGGEINDPYKQMGVPGAILSGYYSIDKLLTDQ
ncbi:FAD-dependent oxidoreductase [Flavobacteriales bacterium]|nr:FAD-dependent oxidoreductase [Flavobacteriales bacterium]